MVITVADDPLEVNVVPDNNFDKQSRLMHREASLTSDMQVLRLLNSEHSNVTVIVS